MSDAANFRLLGAQKAALDPDLQVAGATEKDTGTAEAIGSTAGGILGAIVGTYFGGPAGGALGAKAGSKTGGGLGKVLGGGDADEGLQEAFIPDEETLSAAARFGAAKLAASNSEKK
jgi:hypothetical protein